MVNWGKKKRFHPLVLIGVLVMLALIPLLSWQRYKRTLEEHHISICFISKRIDDRNDFWASMVEGVQMAAQEYEIDITIMGPEAEGMHEEQNAMIEAAIRKRPDAIALVPGDYVLTLPYARKIEEAGIPLVLLDSVMEEEAGVCVVSTDNYEGGHKLGAFMEQHADEGSVIGVVSHMYASSTAIEREQGVRAGLGRYETQIADVIYCDADSEKAYQQTREMLARHPRMNMIVGLNEDASRGAANAVKDMGLGEEILIVGFDSSMEQIQFLEEGIFDAIVVQKPLNMGYLGIRTTYEAVKNERQPEYYLDSGSVLITKETLYTKENEKLLFPFRQPD